MLRAVTKMYTNIIKRFFRNNISNASSNFLCVLIFYITAKSENRGRHNINVHLVSITFPQDRTHIESLIICFDHIYNKWSPEEYIPSQPLTYIFKFSRKDHYSLLLYISIYLSYLVYIRVYSYIFFTDKRTQVLPLSDVIHWSLSFRS